MLICRISEQLQQSIFTGGTYRSLGIDTQELICNSKFALMVSLPAAKRQGDRWFDGIIGIKYILTFLNDN